MGDDYTVAMGPDEVKADLVAGSEDAAKRKVPLLEESEFEALRPVCQLQPNRAVALIGEATADGTRPRQERTAANLPGQPCGPAVLLAGPPSR